MASAVMAGVLAVLLAACEVSRGADIRLFTGGRVEMGFRRDGAVYRRITFERCERPDQIRLGAPTDRLVEFAVMLPDGSIETADEPTLRRIERDEVQIRIFDDRVEYHPVGAPLDGLPPEPGTAPDAPPAGPCLSFE